MTAEFRGEGVADLVSPSEPESRTKTGGNLNYGRAAERPCGDCGVPILSREAGEIPQTQHQQSEHNSIDDKNCEGLCTEVPNEPCDRRISHDG